MRKVLVNKCYGGFGFSEEFENHLRAKYPDLFDDELCYIGYGGWFDFRSGLVADEAIEFGLDRASGMHADLCIEMIPDGASYSIHEYDGMEYIQYTFVTLNMSDLRRGLTDEQLDLVSKVNFVQVNDDLAVPPPTVEYIGGEELNEADSWDGDETHRHSWEC